MTEEQEKEVLALLADRLRLRVEVVRRWDYSDNQDVKVSIGLYDTSKLGGVNWILADSAPLPDEPPAR